MNTKADKTDPVRAQFEDWARSKGLLMDRRPDGEYRRTDTLNAWVVWQAALAQQAGPVEMSPEFTDTARAAIAWVLYHHQGGSSPIGQPLRMALGMGQHESLPDWRIAEAKRYAALAGAETADFHRGRAPQPAIPEGMISLQWLEENHMAWIRSPCDTPYLEWLRAALLAAAPKPEAPE